MLEQTVALAYCQDNEATARDIQTDLSGAIYFRTFCVGIDQQTESLADQLSGFTGPIILLVNDNFLRSSSAMRHGLRLLNEHADRILPVITMGTTKDADTGKELVVATNFDRVSDIIQYVNFWQDRYLDLRRQRREAEGDDEAAFDTYLRLVRDISSEVGEFLRVLRGTWHLKHEEFKVKNYEQLFIFLDASDAWADFNKKTPAPAAADPVAEVSTAESTAPAEEPAEEIEEVVEEVLEEAIEEDVSEIDLATIPGMDQLGIDLSKTHESQPPSEDSAEEPTLNPTEDSMNGTATNEEPKTEASPVAASAESEEEEIVVMEEVDLDEQLAMLIQKAWDMADSGEGRDGLHLIEAGLEQHAGRNDLRYHYALMQAQIGDNIQEAKDQTEMILAADPDHLDAIFLAGELAELSNEPQEALHFYQRVLSIDEEHPDIHLRTGALLLKHFPDQKMEAAEHYQKAIQQQADDAEATYQYALLLQDPLNHPEKAIEYLNQTLRIDPAHPFAHYDLALLYHQQNDRVAAHNAYQSAIQNNASLKTPENDRAFAPISTSLAFADQAREQETLSALRDNINQLEEMLKAREAEAEERSKQRSGTGKTVMITGATSGIGRATAERFAKEGYRLILTGRREERLAEIKAQFSESYEVEVMPLNFDIRKAKSAQATLKKLPKDWQSIDILINNAGKARGFDFIHEGDISHWDEMIDTNIKGVLYMTRAVSPGMVERGSGHIINVCSTAGHEVYPKGAVYCATKFAVDAITQGTRLDLHRFGIRVSQVSPAHVEETEFALVRFDGDQERAKIYEDFKPLSSADVAEAIYYQASQPPHVNVQDILMMGTQQASNIIIDRSGRSDEEE